MIGIQKDNREGARRPTGLNKPERTVIIYSPDQGLSSSLALLFQDSYKVVTISTPDVLEASIEQPWADLVIMDAVPTHPMISRISRMKAKKSRLAILMLYVYSPKYAALEESVRPLVDSFFYKPVDIEKITTRVQLLLPVCAKQQTPECGS